MQAADHEHIGRYRQRNTEQRKEAKDTLSNGLIRLHQGTPRCENYDEHEDVKDDAHTCERDETLEKALAVQPPLPLEEILPHTTVNLVHTILLTIITYHKNALIVAQ